MSYNFSVMKESLLASMRVIDIAQSGSGRTTRMFEKVRDRDAIICTTGEAGHLRHEVRRRGLRVDVRAGDPYEFTQRRETSFLRGQHYTHFTHAFAHQVIEQEIMLMCAGLEKRFKALNAVENERRTKDAVVEMMAPNPIWNDIPFTPVDLRNPAMPSRNSTPDDKL